jgi:hypothetical protein
MVQMLYKVPEQVQPLVQLSVHGVQQLVVP